MISASAALPTDSLYKFMAILGTISFIAGTYLMFIDDQKSMNLLYQYDKKWQAFHEEDEALKYEFKKMTADSTKPAWDAFWKKNQELRLREVDLNSDWKFIQQHNNGLLSYVRTTMWMLLSLGGEVIALIGYILWYVKIQRPTDNELTQKILKEGEWYSRCQSCLKTFFYINERGLESDGTTISKLFCSDCYQRGSFTEPSLTAEEASERLRIKLSDLKYKKQRIDKDVKNLAKVLRWSRIKQW